MAKLIMNPTTTDIKCVIKVEPQESPVSPENKSILQTETEVKKFELKVKPKPKRPQRSKTKRPLSSTLDKPQRKWTKGGYKGGYKCLVCLKTFNDPSNFNRHKRTHWDEEKKHKYKCTACTLTFTRSDNFKKHFEISHMQDTEETKPDTRTCSTTLAKVGGKTFKRNFFLMNCDMCSYTTHLKSSLESHVINKHVVDKEFPCESCTRMFIDEKAVARHVRQCHSLRFKCDICSKSFSQKSHFDQHLFIHSRTKPFVCSVCDHPFKSKSALLAHTKKNHPKRVKTEPRPTSVLTNPKQSKLTTTAKSETKVKRK